MVSVRGFDPRYIGSIPISPAKTANKDGDKNECMPSGIKEKGVQDRACGEAE